MANVDELMSHAIANPMDIHEHLQFMHDLVVENNYKSIAELGVRSGCSTVAFLSALNKTGGKLWSCDIEPIYGYGLEIEGQDNWTFVQGDDLEVVKDAPRWLDVLFIDTSHAYDQTLAELQAYSPRVKKKGVILLHDTELEWPEGITNDIPFPVKKAILDFIGDDWSFENRENCYGLGILRRT